MTTLLAIAGALGLAAIPLVLGWRSMVGEAELANALGLTQPEKKLDLEKFARQTGAGLTTRQLLAGIFVWTFGGVAGGARFGPVGAVLFGLGGALLYGGTLASRREDLRMAQAKDILRAMGVLESLLTQGRSLNDALAESSEATGPQGQLVLADLLVRLRGSAVDAQAEAVRAWTTAWSSPAVDLVGTALLAALQDRIEITPLVGSLREMLNGVVDVLSRARSAAKGVEWQARFLANFPPAVLAAIALTTPDMGVVYGNDPVLLLPVLGGSALSYMLSMKMIRTGLSIEASLGLQGGEAGLIRLDRMGKVL